MWQNAHDAYLESRIYSADPTELIRLLYQTATGAVRNARHHLAAGDIRARTRSITAACEILIELAGSLDHARGGEISRRLAQLYDYMTRKLIEAHFQQSDAPLAEVLGLLATLAEAWNGLKQPESASPAVAAESPWASPLPRESAAGSASQAWSF
ncbi:Flagellar protein FliS [Candidatus Sulfopaludibacter sp. SbA4]|nr:Flagellar protein FliS [Candidatus Sulfopaludibacter sp. SbA4]